MGSKPFSKQELKILVYNKMKHKGMTYDDAYREVNEEIRSVKSNKKKENTFDTFRNRTDKPA